VFTSAKQLTDRHSPAIEQEALASLLEEGAYDRHVRRMRRLNGERRKTLLNALRLRFADTVVIEGADAGLHFVAWLKQLPRSMEASLIESSRRAGVGVHCISPLYDGALNEERADQIGLVMGYAALEPRQIQKGVQLLAKAVQELTAQRP
jgi:GntR family transcriptional regulator/MocR family aminotransferase